MKRLYSFILSTLLLFALSFTAKAEYFTDIILTSPNGLWTDTRAYTTLSDAITAVGSSQRTIIISASVTANNLTIPANVTLKFEKDGAIDITGTLTVLTRNVVADHRQIFSGSGTVSGLSYVDVTWFGAKGDGITDDRVAMQKAFSSIGPGGSVYVGYGNYRVVNATGVGGTVVIQRADALANGTIYPLTLSQNGSTLSLVGLISATSLLGNVIEVTGDDCSIIGHGGGVIGPGTYLDTNSPDPTLQWHPTLIRFTGDRGKVSGVKVVDPPARGIAGDSVYGMSVYDNYVVGGPVGHGGGTVSHGIAFQGTSYFCSATNNYVATSTSGGTVYSGIFNISHFATLSNNRFDNVQEHAIYNYGSDTVMSNNTSNASTRAAHIQSYNDRCVISGNALSFGIGGISVRGSGLVISNNTVTGFSQTGIVTRSYPPALTDGVVISNNHVEFDPLTTPADKQSGIDVAYETTSKNIIVEGNIIKYSGLYPPVDFDALVVRGITATVVSDVTVANNIIEESDSIGIRLVNLVHAKIVGNQVINPCREGACYGIHGSNILNSEFSRNKVTADSAKQIAFSLLLDGTSNLNTVKDNNFWPFDRAPIGYVGTIFGETKDISVGSIAAGDIDERPLMSVKNAPNGIYLLDAFIINADTVAAHGTNYENLFIQNKATDGVGYFIVATSGGTANITPGDTIVGASSGATAYVEAVLLQSGTWDDGSATAFLMLSAKTGVFIAENLNVPGKQNDIATIPAGDLLTPYTIATFTTQIAALTAFRATQFASYNLRTVMHDSVLILRKDAAAAGAALDNAIIVLQYVTF